MMESVRPSMQIEPLTRKQGKMRIERAHAIFELVPIFYGP